MMFSWFVIVLATYCSALEDTELPENALERRIKRGITEAESYLVIDNRSGRKITLYYSLFTTNDRSQEEFMSIMPNHALKIDTYNTTKWFAKDNRGRYMLFNGRESYVSEANHETEKNIAIVTYPGLPAVAFPKMYIETLLVMDYSIYQLFKSVQKTKNYGMTILQLVNKVYQHGGLKKLDLHITVVASEIHVITDQRGPKIKPEQSTSNLHIACTYMKQISRRSRKRYDHMVFFTRESLGMAGGYASRETMCTTSSCSIVNDHGFTSAFIMAHEMGHTIGLHDKTFPRTVSDNYVMAAAVSANFGNFAWSSYSLGLLVANLRDYYCLRNPSRNNKNLPAWKAYPGENFSFEKQCLLEYGPKYTKYAPHEEEDYYKNPCVELRCSPKALPMFYRTLGSPQLDGTACGKTKWCIQAECVPKDGSVKNAVRKNHLGEWSSWSSCSTTCGVGISSRVRFCSNPSDQRKCNGKERDVKECNRDKKCSMSAGALKEQPSEKSLLDCTFKYGLCSWKSVKDADVEWVRGRSASDYYMYIKRGRTTSKKRKAKLVSPTLSAQQACLVFQYKMQGGYRLKVKLLSTQRDTSGSLWNKKENVDHVWRTAKVNIKNKAPYQIVIEAVVSGKTIGMIKLRNTQFKREAC